MKSLMVALAVLSMAADAAARCATEAEVAAFVADYVSNRPAAALAKGGAMEDALCTQAKLTRALTPHMGPAIGYKVGLTSKPAQKWLGVSEPVRGVLFRDMMLESGAVVPVNWGARPVFEADLVLVVGDAAINRAATPEEAMAHVASVRPFLELSDLTLAAGEPFNAVTITAASVAPKLGVLGAAIPVEDSGRMARALGAMEVELRAADGEVLVKAPGTAVLGHPANSLLWLVSKGVELRPGDMVSVGSFGPLFPPAKGKGGASVTYSGLPGEPTVRVTFE